MAGFAEERPSPSPLRTASWSSGVDRPTTQKAAIFLHRGIAARQFQRSFVLAEGVDVGEAVMENGLLHVDLTRSKPDNGCTDDQHKEGLSHECNV